VESQKNEIEHQDVSYVDDTDSVRPNDQKVLELLSEDKSSYTFKGLMRKLGMHQESLSRSLHRLDELGLVIKSDLGYRLSSRGERFAKDSNNARSPYVPLLQTYIPPGVDSGKIVGNLAGRWFKNLYWLGMTEGISGQMLQWVSENDTFQVNLRIVGNYIIIETNAVDEKAKVEAMVSSYRIFEYLSKLYGSHYGIYTFSTISNIEN
jgi:hypothetical protein